MVSFPHMSNEKKNSVESPEQIIEKAAAAILSLHQVLPEIQEAIIRFVATLEAGNKILTAGNGGSAAEAMHMAEELSGRYKNNRRHSPPSR